MWYQSPAVWVAAATFGILAILLVAVWVALNLGLERGEKRAAERYRDRLSAAELEARVAWQVNRERPAAVYTDYALGYPDALQAMPPADAGPGNTTGPWHYPRRAEGPGLLPDAPEPDPPGP